MMNPALVPEGVTQPEKLPDSNPPFSTFSKPSPKPALQDSCRIYRVGGRQILGGMRIKRRGRSLIVIDVDLGGRAGKTRSTLVDRNRKRVVRQIAGDRRKIEFGRGLDCGNGHGWWHHKFAGIAGNQG